MFNRRDNDNSQKNIPKIGAIMHPSKLIKQLSVLFLATSLGYAANNFSVTTDHSINLQSRPF